jgi:hypothetical protein
MNFNAGVIGYAAFVAKELLQAGAPAPPMIIIACHCGDFTTSRQCLGESMLFMSGGPVAVVAAVTESHPLTNYFSGLCLMQALNGKKKSIGTLWLTAQQQMMSVRNVVLEWALRDVEGKLEDEIDVSKLRRDQILMYALLGDPATGICLPDSLQTRNDYGPNGWHWQVDKPHGATRLYVSFRSDKQKTPNAQEPSERTVALERFRQANAAFAFTALAELSDDKIWEGIINESGTLRLVATGAGQIYVGVVKLKLPDLPAPSDTPTRLE